MSIDGGRPVKRKVPRRQQRQSQPSMAFMQGLDARWLAVIALAGIAAYAVLLRTLHVFDSRHYFILNIDSHFFHWLAGRVMNGMGPPEVPPFLWQADIYTLHSGLAYPLAYIARGVASVSDLSRPEALDFTCKFVPPVLGILIMVVIYMAASRMFNRRVALMSCLAWAASGHAILYGGAAGSIDRDVLNMLLLSTGVFAFFFAGRWKLVVSGRNTGWLAAGLITLAAELLLYLEWNYVGPVLMLTLIIATSIADTLVGDQTAGSSDLGRWRKLKDAMATEKWRAFAFVIGANLVALAAVQSQVGSWYRIAINTVTGGGRGIIDELQGVWARGFLDFANFHFLLIPLGIGLYLALRRRDSGSVFFTSWFLILVVLSMFSSRVLIYAVPAASVLAGIGLSRVWDWGGWTVSKSPLRRSAVIGLFVLVVIFSFLMVSFMLATPKITIDDDWRDALTHVRDNTDSDSVIMAWWDYGYWILDVAQRRPVADPGFYGWNVKMMADVRSAYLTTVPAEAAQVMDKYGADFLIFSQLDDAPIIMSWPSRPTSQDDESTSFPEDSLAARCLGGDFDQAGGLEMWYPARVDGEVEVAVLRRAPM